MKLKAWFDSRSEEIKVAIVIGIVTLIVTMVLGVAGVIAQLAGAEVRCWIGLDECTNGKPDSKSTATPRTSTPGGKASSEPTDDPEGPPDPTKPYAGVKPAPRRLPNMSPFVELSFYDLTNRGKLVPIPIIGSGFTANSNVNFEIFSPSGASSGSGGYDTDERGIFTTVYGWVPFQYKGIEGNNGGWKLVFTDTVSGKKTVRLFVVKSDDQTPEPSQWDRPDALDGRRSGSPSISVSASGTLCKGSGVRTETTGAGFTPDSALTVKFYRSDGQKLGQRDLTANGDGKIDRAFDYWIVSSCESGVEFQYRFEVTEKGTERKASGTVYLPSK
ncbi:hypothetical protein E1263_05555 [Kribbella antibiotica]|uniref:Uncharacterized protein n=1 Tax=Kribbella antibiotica TaxID=190195 RepID=A0A4R4ZSL6_9ACTN|nr:hypothetical protein [Kribbella antibiotica]TDD62078.1 hypothetical protein E1263_05555 [Kribbella antibiotica]